MQRDPLIVGSIVGDIVDYFDASARLRVLYDNREITIGSELRPSHLANQPTVQITGLAGSLYTLVSDHFYIHTSRAFLLVVLISLL
jgi:protein FLOWERING LOCUS T